MFAPETTRSSRRGPALIVGTVGADGVPHATRGWGLTVLDPGAGEIRLLLDAPRRPDPANLARDRGDRDHRDRRTHPPFPADEGHLHGGRARRPISIPNGRLGTATRSSPTIETTERTPRELLERLAPSALVACTVRVTELFDQTPGPAAGTPMPATGPT